MRGDTSSSLEASCGHFCLQLVSSVNTHLQDDQTKIVLNIQEM